MTTATTPRPPDPAPVEDRGGMAQYLLGAASGAADAIVDGGRRHSYAELRDAVATLTARLLGLGLQPGTPVALVAPNGLFWAAAYIATMQAGMVTVPLPLTLTLPETLARIRWIGAGAVLLAGPARHPVAAALPPEVAVIGDGALLEGPVQWRACPTVVAPPDTDAAYLFTSGTTGQPRAVRLTRGNIQANTESILGYLELRATDRALVVLPFTYVFGASLLHTHLRVGAELITPRSVAYPESTVNLLESESCTVFAGVPSVFQVLLRNSTFARRRLPDLRLVQQAGGRLPPALVKELVEAQPHARVFVMYGATEATARLSALPPDELATRPGSIGRGIPGVTLRVVGEDGAEVAPGVVGEIRARGENISPGYVGDPAASAAKMPDGELHTGDLATVDEDGFIYIVDRIEHFIKTWGHRVASHDVEGVVIELPDLIAVAAVGMPDEAAGERVELLVVRRPGADLTADDIVAHCRRRLPKQGVPAAVHFADRLPTNVNGKVVVREVRSWIAAATAEGGHP